jgi:2-oxoisovalerate dehydrogenase E2 component (dihydrolipoyl transacylase)
MPSARILAKAKGIDLKHIKGTGKHGVIRKEDVMSYRKASPVPSGTAEARTVPLHSSTTKKMTKVGHSMAKSMTESLKIPHLTFSDEVCMDNLIALRKQLNESIPNHKKLTFMPFFLKAMSIAITDFPIVNSKMVENLEEYEDYAHHNISVAIDTPYGLHVPNIKNCEQKSLTQLQDELRRLQDLGKENKIPLEDALGGTISLSNVGTLGGTSSVPVIFPPQVFIAGISGIRPVLRKVKGEVHEANVIGISYSADHRLIDGATTARFSKRWKQLVENPMLMLLSLK